jgi:hypothetical protein
MGEVLKYLGNTKALFKSASVQSKVCTDVDSRHTWIVKNSLTAARDFTVKLN